MLSVAPLEIDEYLPCNKPTMPSVQCFRQFFNERLTAAAEEIFTVFEKTIVEYEEEIKRQRKLLDVFMKPEVNIHRIELPRQHVCEQQVPAHSQLFNQTSNFSLDRGDSQSPQVKKEEEEVEEELFPSQNREELVLKEDPDLVLLSLSYGVDHHNKNQSLFLNNDDDEYVDSMPVKISEVPEQNTDHQLLPHSSHLIENQEDSVLSTNAETKPHNAHHTNKKLKSTMSTIPINTRVKKSYKCYICGKLCVCLSKLIRHQRSHTGVKPYPCDICGKSFLQTSALTVHKRIHTGEKPYSCDVCGKAFTRSSVLKDHRRIHTGEKPYVCDICGDKFRDTTSLKRHVVRHTSKKLYLCYTCGEGFLEKSDFINHTISHSDEKTCS